MASIHSYQTKKGERRYDVRYRDGEGRQRSRAFSTHKTPRRSRSRSSANGSPPIASSPGYTYKVEGRRLFNEGEVRQWLRSRHGAGR
jgi:hypothetical protein